jgi:type II secretion system protein G
MIKKQGFTLIELLVVIAIIGLLASIVLVSLNATRKKARDSKRLSDLKQIQLAIEMYYDDNGYYPKEGDGANGKVGEGAGLDNMLSPYMAKVPADPLGPGDTTHYYYYDGNQLCSGGPYSNIAVLFARTMEVTAGNASDICSSWGGEGGAGGANAYHIYIGPSSDVY